MFEKNLENYGKTGGQSMGVPKMAKTWLKRISFKGGFGI